MVAFCLERIRRFCAGLDIFIPHRPTLSAYSHRNRWKTAMHPGLFLLLICLSRSTRFMAECAAIKYLGQKVQSLPRQYYHYATILLGMVLVMVMIIFTFF